LQSSQYGSETGLEEKRCKKLMDNAKSFVQRVKEILEEIN